MGEIRKLLVANRGEIAVRVLRTAREMGIATVAVYSDADAHALFVKMADEAVALKGVSPLDTYLDQQKIIDSAKRTGADAIHPGYGFLSENADFAKLCRQEGLVFIGPSHEVIRKLGSKSGAKEVAIKAGVPVVPGYNGDDQSPGRFKYEAEEIGYPVLLKASAGGGGKGMRIVNKPEEFEESFLSAKREAEKSFGEGTLLMEKYFISAKHIEFQIFGDSHGNYVHLFDRECSLQRRYQKVVEEAPSPSLNDELRKQMGEAAMSLAAAVHYTNAGTVEFLLDADKNFYFLEVNTRLQVEHPVTEMVTMLDLVRLQIQVAEGQPLPDYVKQIELHQMHSIECRICAEDPANGFLPCTGKILVWNESDMESVRYDTGIESGSLVTPYYDSMIAKLIVVEENRSQAMRLMSRAIDETVILGVKTNKDFLKSLINHPDFIDGTFDTKLIERELSGFRKLYTDYDLHVALTGAFLLNWNMTEQEQPFSKSLNGWRNIFYREQEMSFTFEGIEHTILYRYVGNEVFEISIQGNQYKVELQELTGSIVSFSMDGYRHTLFAARESSDFYLQHITAGVFTLSLQPRFRGIEQETSGGSYKAPMPGEVVKVLVKPGDRVAAGSPLIVMNSMKMETTIEANHDAEVLEVFVIEKGFVDAGAELLKMKE